MISAQFRSLLKSYRSIPYSEKDDMILKLSELRVAECVRCVQKGEKLLRLCGYRVAKTTFS